MQTSSLNIVDVLAERVGLGGRGHSAIYGGLGGFVEVGCVFQGLVFLLRIFTRELFI